MNRKAQGLPVQTIAIIVLVVIVMVTIAVFFFTGLSAQGGVLGNQSQTMVGNIESEINYSEAFNWKGLSKEVSEWNGLSLS